MKKNLSVFLYITASLTTPSFADDLSFSTAQIKALGIVSIQLPPSQAGELSGIPAQVVLPGNQLFAISSSLPALVEQTSVGVGDTVRKGQVLAILQSPALAETERALIQTYAQLQLAEDNLLRDEKLWKDGIISESRFRATSSLHREARAAYSERRQLLKLAGMSEASILKLQNDGMLTSQLEVLSPISGTILEKTVSAGQHVDSATPLFKVAKLTPLALEIQAPPASVGTLKIGNPVNIPAHNAHGKLTAIGRSLSNTNQTVLLRALILQGANNLHPGQFVEVSLGTSGGKGKQWNVPNSALARLDKQTVIFVETTSGFRTEKVSVMYEGATNSTVSGPLKGDEKIAVQGVSSLKASLMGIGGGE